MNRCEMPVEFRPDFEAADHEETTRQQPPPLPDLDTLTLTDIAELQADEVERRLCEVGSERMSVLGLWVRRYL